AKFLVRKVMGIDLQRFPLGTVLLADIRLFAERFLLLGIDRDRRAPAALASPNPPGDMLELSVSIRGVGPFSRFPIPLQRVSQRSPNLGDLGATDLEALVAKFALQVAQTLAGPSPGSLGISSLRRFNEAVDRIDQILLMMLQSVASAPLAAVASA